MREAKDRWRLLVASVAMIPIGVLPWLQRGQNGFEADHALLFQLAILAGLATSAVAFLDLLEDRFALHAGLACLGLVIGRFALREDAATSGAYAAIATATWIAYHGYVWTLPASDTTASGEVAPFPPPSQPAAPGAGSAPPPPTSPAGDGS